MTAIMKTMVAPECVNIPRPWTDWIGVESVDERTCSVEGCPGKHKARGLCDTHYSRERYRGTFREHGTIRLIPEADALDVARSAGLTPVEPYPGGTAIPWRLKCDVCGQVGAPTLKNLRKGQGGCLFCRPRKIRETMRTRGTYYRAGDAVSYNGLHRRLRSVRGQASLYACVDCGNPAEDWSYEGGGGLDERCETVGGSLLKYSVNMDHYWPRCKMCHASFDRKLENA